MAAAFGLGRAVGPLAALSYRSSPTWTLAARAGRFLVKHVAAEEWRDDFARAMRFEDKALAAGIAMGRPVSPEVPALGYAAEVDGIGLVRVYEWIDGRPLEASDDVSTWLGSTLARLHRIEPDGRPEAAPEWYRLDDRALWDGWLQEGERLRKPWAPSLREGLTGILGAAAWVSRAFLEAGDYVVTHRDVEPWNVLVTATGPVLIDWDVAGPDSARLEAAQATLSFSARDGMPDPGVVRRTIGAYVDGGGVPFSGADVMVRRVGLRLGRLAERLRMSLGLQSLGPHDLAGVEARAAEQIADMPGFVERVRLFGSML
ncbi:Ser/Thr protein kinase RdoA involved in Cpx stress response, MazF antagonist [Paractinoplanes atraurantiacus]|uniref:Ser/Thr protein kinase RdoA involved in Cpx stress response, MazF antagonist n=1 Tax=Paractinoplanes atraurantiacus TaxID=1036182 RepID=A0A285JEM9_9ACTN|nr:Ser/Thr protein kinase RdoA involved in Cpx stress response, MazF antagonist [Actinoplanes atraurantiacus]